MKKKFLTVLGGALLGLFSMSATAQTDVTSTLVNPSFETGNVGAISSLDGWTLPSLGANYSNISLGSNSACNGQAYGFSAASDGSQYFYNRQGWGAATSSLSQAVTLPAGKYYISVDYKGIQKGGTTSKLGFSIDGTSIISTTPFYAADGTDGSYATNDPWKTLGAWFTVDEEKSVTIAITETLEGGSARADLYLDNVKLYQWDADDDVNYANASATSPMDVTAKFVKNPYFDSNVNDWTTTTGYSNKGRATNQGGAISGGFWENWNSSAKTSGKMYQTLSGLTDGIYRLTAAAFADQGTSEVYLYIGDKKEKITAAAPSVYSVQCSVVGGTTEIGLVLGESNAAKWIGLDNVKLEYLGFDATAALKALAETVNAVSYSEKHSTKSEEDLQTAIAAANLLINAGTATKAAIATASTNLSSAIAAVEASIADYATLNAAIAAVSYTVITPPDNENYVDLDGAKVTALGVYNAGTAESCADAIATLDAAVKAAKVADYGYVTGNFQYGVTLDTWTTTGYVSDFSNEHWSGINDKDHSYKNQDDSNGRGYNSNNGFTIGLNQDVKLPAGSYIFKACGRKSTGATMTLTVKNGDEVLGSVSDFPSGNANRGINKSGGASFDEDDDAYANNGKGFGWEWRFVSFELTEETTVNVAVSASATTKSQWASFGNYSVLTNDEANIAMIAYNIALNDAKAANANDTYKNVTGVEKTALNNAISATPGTTKVAIEAATTTLQEVTTAFKAAAPAYDAYVACIDKVDDLDDAGKAKFAELESDLEGLDATTISAGVIESVPASYTEALKAQTTPGADLTGIIVNAAVTSTDGWNGSRTNANEQYTGAPDNTYFDVYNETRNMTQNIGKLQLGIYSLKCATRASTGMTSRAGNVYVSQNSANLASTNIHTDGNTGGELGNGWSWTEVTFVVTDDANDITIGFYSDCGSSQWAGADNFSLTFLGDASANMTVADVQWGTFVAPFAVAIPEDVEAYTCDAVEGDVITTTEVETTIPANTPVLVHSENPVNQTFYGKAVSGTPEYGIMVGTYEAILAPVGSYVLQKNNDVFSFYKVVNAQPTVGANRCYIVKNSGSTMLRFGGATNIQNMEQQDESVVYDLTGRRVDAATKGIYIVNGKKMLVK